MYSCLCGFRGRIGVESPERVTYKTAHPKVAVLIESRDPQRVLISQRPEMAD